MFFIKVNNMSFYVFCLQINIFNICGANKIDDATQLSATVGNNRVASSAILISHFRHRRGPTYAQIPLRRLCDFYWNFPAGKVADTSYKSLRYKSCRRLP